MLPYGIPTTESSPEIQQTISAGNGSVTDDDRIESDSPSANTRRSKSSKKARKPRTIYRFGAFTRRQSYLESFFSWLVHHQPSVMHIVRGLRRLPLLRYERIIFASTANQFSCVNKFCVFVVRISYKNWCVGSKRLNISHSPKEPNSQPTSD